MSEGKFLDQFKQAHKLQLETYSLLVQIGKIRGAVPTEAVEMKTPEEPRTDIGKARLLADQMTRAAQENLELACQIHAAF